MMGEGANIRDLVLFDMLLDLEHLHKRFLGKGCGHGVHGTDCFILQKLRWVNMVTIYWSKATL
jgi:hypothetical protein